MSINVDIKIPNIINDNIINNKIKGSLYKSTLDETNPIVIQLIEFGYDRIYSRRVFHYLHPDDIEEALNYMSEENGIIQHRFVQNRRDIENKLCYICGQHEEFHLKEININNNEEIKIINFIEKNSLNESKDNKSINTLGNHYIENDVLDEINKNVSSKEIESFDSNKEFSYKEKNFINKNKEDFYIIKHNNININKIKEDKIELKNEKLIKKECKICNEEFIVTDKNKVKNCGHSYCDGCWFDSLSIKIKENKLPSIKCLDYNCKEKLDDEFIINILGKDKDLIKRYKRYKLELLIINDPNKKLCPYPDCDSYLELKNIKEKDVTCLNNHKYCFICLKKPHGNLACDKKDIDKSMLEFAKNNFVKKCPNCGIITEKNNGCNHITCSKCGYQWCWLCNQEYSIDHFNQGKCRGFQFFQPKNDYEIKLVMEGKIKADELSNSQRQFENDFQIELDEFPRNGMDVRNIVIIDQERINNEIYNNADFSRKLYIVLFQLVFGHFLFVSIIPNSFFKSVNIIIYILITFSMLIPLIIINIIAFIIRMIFSGYKNIIIQYIRNDYIFYRQYLLLVFNINTLIPNAIYKFILKKVDIVYLRFFLFFSDFLIFILVLYPQRIICNVILLLLGLIFGGRNDFFISLNHEVRSTFDINILEIN